MIWAAPAQTWITSSLTISETNTNYNGADLVISGAGVTVALDGPHAFNSLLLTHGAVLTHSPSTASQTHKLDRLAALFARLNPKPQASWAPGAGPYGTAWAESGTQHARMDRSRLAGRIGLFHLSEGRGDGAAVE